MASSAIGIHRGSDITPPLARAESARAGSAASNGTTNASATSARSPHAIQQAPIVMPVRVRASTSDSQRIKTRADNSTTSRSNSETPTDASKAGAATGNSALKRPVATHSTVSASDQEQHPTTMPMRAPRESSGDRERGALFAMQRIVPEALLKTPRPERTTNARSWSAPFATSHFARQWTDDDASLHSRSARWHRQQRSD